MAGKVVANTGIPASGFRDAALPTERGYVMGSVAYFLVDLEMQNDCETFFLHTKIRIVERYQDILGQPIEINREVWDSWNKAIRLNSKEVIFWAKPEA